MSTGSLHSRRILCVFGELFGDFWCFSVGPISFSSCKFMTHLLGSQRNDWLPWCIWSQSSWRGEGGSVSDYLLISFSWCLFPVITGIPQIFPFLVHFLYGLNLLFQWSLGSVRQGRRQGSNYLRPQTNPCLIPVFRVFKFYKNSPIPESFWDVMARIFCFVVTSFSVVI